MHGFHGSYLRLRIEGERLHRERVPIPVEVLRAYLGGVGLGAWIWQREVDAGVDPFAPEAPIVFAFSPLVGTPLTTSAKFAVVARSPLTGLLCDALASSHFAIAGKRLGVDAIVVSGRARRPSVIVDGRLEPTSLWGASPAATAEALARHGRVAAIGRAGENRVRFASLCADGRHAGRGGLGAVLGASRLKALAVRGGCATSLADPTAVARLARRLARGARGPATAKYRELGTAANMEAFARVGALPGRNFSATRAPSADPLGVDALRSTRAHSRSGCASCAIGCEHRYAHGGGGSVRVEYESLFALGPLCGIEDADAVLDAARRCDALGLDTLSAGGTLAFAMECVERGLLEAGPRFGDAAGLAGWLDDIAARRGLGDLLAEGSRRAAARIGGDSIDFAPQVKGLELPGYEPRALQTLALGLAVATRGADHNRSSAYELDFSEEVDRLRGDARAAQRAIEPEDRAALLDSLILCKFVRGALEDPYRDAAAMLRAVTGLDFDADELRGVARRVVTLRKACNEREGWQPADDTLPARLLREPIAQGPVCGAAIDAPRLGAMVRGYNRARGWHDDGHLPAAAREDLFLDA